ncbi:MAG: hypothetical protein FWF28_01470 [Micrococcales bacterium]|nr:hypothetical protein [Micrococcales bacterium]
MERWIKASLTIAGHPTTLGDYPLDKINRSLVADWHAAVQRAAKGDSVVVSAYCTLRTLMNSAVDDELIATSPVHVKGAGTLHSPERLLASPAEVKALRAAMPAKLALVVDIACWARPARSRRWATWTACSPRRSAARTPTVPSYRRCWHTSAAATPFG